MVNNAKQETQKATRTLSTVAVISEVGLISLLGSMVPKWLGSLHLAIGARSLPHLTKHLTSTPLSICVILSLECITDLHQIVYIL